MDEDVYYIDVRNADHRVRPTGVVPTRPVGLAPAAAARVLPASPAVYAQPQPTAMVYQQPAFAQPAYAQAAWQPFFSPYGPFGALNGLTLGTIISVGGKLWAAFKGQPAMPQPTGDVAVDMANSILFNNALAYEQKGEKKIEAVSGAIAELLGAR